MAGPTNSKMAKLRAESLGQQVEQTEIRKGQVWSQQSRSVKSTGDPFENRGSKSTVSLRPHVGYRAAVSWQPLTSSVSHLCNISVGFSTCLSVYRSSRGVPLVELQHLSPDLPADTDGQTTHSTPHQPGLHTYPRHPPLQMHDPKWEEAVADCPWRRQPLAIVGIKEGSQRAHPPATPLQLPL